MAVDPHHAFHADTVVVASSQQVSSDLAGETVLLSLVTARYYGFGGVGARIWELIAAPTTVRAICNAVAAEYDVDATRAERDVRDFLGQLAERGLVEVRSAI